jgi:hypothetical protein
MTARLPRARRAHPIRLHLLLCCFAALLLSSACSSDPTRGYSFQPARSAQVRTITIPVFDNQTFSHDIEVQLTEAIVKEIQRTTPWRILSGQAAGSADTSLTGTINASTTRALSNGRTTGLAQEVGVTLTVDFDWRDNRSQKLLVSRRSFTASQAFVPAQGTQERLEIGQFGAIQELARDIVAELRSTW